MRPMTMSRARLTAGATTACAAMAAVPAAAFSGLPAQPAELTQHSRASPSGSTRERTDTKTRASPSGGTRERMDTNIRILHVRRNVLDGRTALVTGMLTPSRPGRVVRLQRRTPHRWRTVDRTLTRTGGAFRLSYRPKRIGTMTLRTMVLGTRDVDRAHRNIGRVNVFRRARASWYALYGSALACGGTLGYDELGVAHKTLPCGTKLTLRYRGRSVRVEVIDRGPYVGGRDFDLTGATKRALGFGDLGTVLATR